MNWLPDIFRRRKIYGDLAEEMRLHLEERTEQLISEGMSRQEAQEAARRAVKCGSCRLWNRWGET
jgi:hypothetical protein